MTESATPSLKYIIIICIQVSFNATVQALMSAGEERSLQADGKKARSLFSKSCCMVKVPPEISQNKETVSFVGSEYYSIKSYHSCGFLWSRRCTRYRLRTRLVIRLWGLKDIIIYNNIETPYNCSIISPHVLYDVILQDIETLYCYKNWKWKFSMKLLLLSCY